MPAAAPDINDAKIVAPLKKGATSAEAAKALGVNTDEVPGWWRRCWRLEPVANPSLKIDPTPKAVAAARGAGLRWERIAARSGMTVPAVKKATRRPPARRRPSRTPARDATTRRSPPRRSERFLRWRPK